jgi:hypothetical protein
LDEWSKKEEYKRDKEWRKAELSGFGREKEKRERLKKSIFLFEAPYQKSHRLRRSANQQLR